MRVTAERAGELLDEVDHVARATRDRASYDGIGPILIVWGIIWTVGFSVVHFAPRVADLTWMIGDVVGVAATLYFGWIRPSRGPILSESARREGRKLLWFWFFVFVYGSVCLAALWPWRTEQFGLFCMLFMMFAYIVMGLWLDVWFLLWDGVAVTVIVGGGYVVLSFFAPGYLNLWLGLAGGGALAGSGVYALYRERHCHA